MADYYDELKGIRKELKSILGKKGIKASVTGYTGTAIWWSDIDKPKNQQAWTKKQLKVLNDDFGFGVGHPRDSITIEMEQLKAKVGGYKHRKFKKSPKYLKLKRNFTECAMAQEDSGTCVLGSGTIVERKGVPIDFWRQHGQSETRDVIAQRIMKNRAKELGLDFRHEAGVMD